MSDPVRSWRQVSLSLALVSLLASATHAADPTPLLVLDSPAAKASIVDANDPTRVAAAPFAGAAALRKGAVKLFYRKPTSLVYQVIVADGAGHLLTQLVDFNLTGPTAPPAAVDVLTLPVSNSAASLSLSCDGKFAVVCGDGATPVSVLDLQTGMELSPLTLANSVTSVVCLDDGVTVLAVQNDVDNGVTGIRRLSLSPTGVLSDTGEFLNLPGAYAVVGVPGTGFGIALNRSPMTDQATAFTIAGMTANNAVPLAGENADSLAFACGGTELIVRSIIMGAPIESRDIIEIFGFDANTGLFPTDMEMLVAPARLSFNVAAAGASSTPGGSLVNVTPDGGLIAAGEGAAVRFYSSADGSFVREFAPGSLSAGDLTFLPCCAQTLPDSTIAEQRIAGPDVDNNMTIDTTIPVNGADPSSYMFTINLSVASPIPSFVVEQVGGAWDVSSVTPDVPTDRVFALGGALASLLRLPTYVIWIPSDNSGSLTFEIVTRRKLFPPTYLPTAPGPVSQTTGAIVVNLLLQPVVNENGIPLLGTAFEVTGVAPVSRQGRSR